MRRRIGVTFNGREYQVSPSFAVIERIEQRFDLYSFMQSVAARSGRTRDIAWVLYCSLAEAGEDIAYADVGEIVLDDIGAAMAAAVDIVSAAISGGPEKPAADDKKKAAHRAVGAE